MKDAINAAIWWACWLWWTTKCMYRLVTGRWFIFRDAPTWFVADTVDVMLYIDLSAEDDEMQEYYRQAEEEMILRKRPK